MVATVDIPTVRPGMELVAGGASGFGAAVEPVRPASSATCCDACASRRPAGLLMIAAGIALAAWFVWDLN